MDKQTLSNYGWIVIVTLVLAVMLAFATPFGNYVGRGAVNTVNALIEMTGNAVDEDSINTKSEEWESQFTHWNKGEGDGDTTAGLGTGGNPSHNHNYKKYTVKEATCTEDGMAVYACECGASYTEVIKATGCKPSNGICTECGKQVGEVVAGLYQTGTNYGTLLKSWDTLVSEEIITGTNNGLIVCNKPKQLNGDLVLSNDPSLTTIGAQGFKSCSGLTGIVIQDNITTIGNQAFGWLSSITKITIPDSVTTYGDGIFMYSKSLLTVNLSKNTSYISEGMFSSCSSLSNFKIPDKVTEIRKQAFNGCSSLLEIKIPDSCTLIGPSAFGGATLVYLEIGKNVKTIEENAFAYVTGNPKFVFGDSLETIGKRAFQCSDITSITIPSSVKTIEEYAFYSCGQLETVHLNEGLTTTGARVFENAVKLKEITIPSTLSNIGVNMFINCDALTKATFANGCKRIGGYMFRSSGITELTLPNTIISIGETYQNPFDDAIGLTTVYFNGTEQQWNDILRIGNTSGATYRLESANVIFTS